MIYMVPLPSQPAPSPNDRTDRRATNSTVQAWREAAAWMARKHRLPRMARAQIVLTMTPADRRRRDATNLYAALKACEDGLVDAGILRDDSSAYVPETGCRIYPPDPSLDNHRWTLEIHDLSDDVA